MKHWWASVVCGCLADKGKGSPLARVILTDAPILILDDATSALISEVGAAIQDMWTK